MVNPHPVHTLKKASKKFGRIVQSPQDNLTRMLYQHRAEVEDFLLGRAGMQLAVRTPEKAEEVADTVMVAMDAILGE